MRRLAAALAILPLAAVAAERLDAALEDRDLADARIAWRYFERNMHPETGLVSSVDGYPSTTAWDIGSSIIAALAANELDLLADEDLDARLQPLLRSLASLPLFDGELPNKAYDAATGRMTDYANRAAPRGIGFSAIDIARLVSGLTLAGELHPAYRERIARVLARWKTCRLVRQGEPWGVHRDASGALRHVQEGRLGYEQYAAKALAILGLDVARARSYEPFLAERTMLGVPVPYDVRDRRRYGALDAVVTEPWALDGLEFGLGDGGAPLARRIFEVQKRRWEQTGIVTALSEDHVDRPPWFVYDAILADGVPWRTVTPEGNAVDGLHGLSTKAAFALAALYPSDPYATTLRTAVADAYDPERGWFAGIYERGGPNRSVSANTNAVILESILYSRRGKLHASCEGCGAWRARLAALAPRPGTCPREDAGSAGGMAAANLRPDAADLGRAGAPSRGAGDGFRAGGSALATYRGAEGPGIGGVATVFPWRAAFLRLGAESTPSSTVGKVRLLWGLGWDDWRPGTFSLTVHNWGPLRPEDAPGWRQAELNAGYKLPRVCSEWLCGSALASVTVPFAGAPYADLRLTFTIGGRWFAMGGIGRTITGAPGRFEAPAGTPRRRMIYGFGLWDWRPGTLFLTYHDWGPDWRARNGVLSLGVNWAF